VPLRKFPIPIPIVVPKKNTEFLCSNKQVKLEDQIKHFDMPKKDIHALPIVPTNKLS
jgi:hypothetical protein